MRWGPLFDESRESAARPACLRRLLDQGHAARSAARGRASRSRKSAVRFIRFLVTTASVSRWKCCRPTWIARLTCSGSGVLARFSNATTFEIEREAQVAELQQDADDVVTFGRKNCSGKKVLRRISAWRGRVGRRSGLAALTPADLAKLWKTYLVSGNVVLAVAGDFERAHAVAQTKGVSRAASRAEPSRRQCDCLKSPAGRRLRRNSTARAGGRFQAFPAPGLRSPTFMSAKWPMNFSAECPHASSSACVKKKAWLISFARAVPPD